MTLPQQHQAPRFVTHDSGARAEYKSGMVRDTQEGKARFGLLRTLEQPYEAQMLTRLAQLMTRGADKYGERNWEKADSLEELERFQESAERHFNQWLAGELDGEDHAAAVMFNVIAAEFVKWKLVERVPPAASLEELAWDWVRPAPGAAPLGANELFVNMDGVP